MGRYHTAAAFLAACIGLVAAASRAAEGDPDNGARVFRACAACHSLTPERHLTGPSLADLWGRKAGTAEGFTRYSEALKAADVVWDAETLDPWLENPRAFIPGNRMIFPGIRDAQARTDLIAYLEGAMGSGESAERQGGGMMGSPQMPDLKEAPPANQVTAIRYCGDTLSSDIRN